MKITEGSIGRLPLDRFVTAISGIYSTKDENRSIWDIWLHTAHHAAAIGEEARKYKPGKKLLEEIADFSMWLFTFVGKIQGTMGAPTPGRMIEESTIRTEKAFSDLIWNKYPGICPVCFGRRVDEGIDTSADVFMEPCDCLLHPVETRGQGRLRVHLKKLRKYADDHRDHSKPKTVDKWQQMFRTIYQANLRHLNLTGIAFHLLEEVGEVSDAIARMYTYDERKFKRGEPTWHLISLENEIADVCSWLFALVNHLDLMPKTAREFHKFVFKRDVFQRKEIKLSGIIWGRYGSNELESLYCPHCKSPAECQCPILLVLDEETLKKFNRYTTNVLT